MEDYVGKNKEVEHQCVYVGPHENNALEPLETDPVSPSPQVAKAVSLSVLGGNRGKYRNTDHCAKRMRERDFDVFDMEYVIRNGVCIELGRYVSEYKNFRYKF